MQNNSKTNPKQTQNKTKAICFGFVSALRTCEQNAETKQMTTMTRIGSTFMRCTHFASARQWWRHCVTSLRSARWLASSLKLAARCPVSGCWPSC